MEFRIASHIDVEVAAGLSADEFNQFAGEAQGARSGESGRQIAAQGHQVIKTVILIILQYFPKIFPGRIDTGHVRRGFYPGRIID